MILGPSRWGGVPGGGWFPNGGRWHKEKKVAPPPPPKAGRTISNLPAMAVGNLAPNASEGPAATIAKRSGSFPEGTPAGRSPVIGAFLCARR